MLIFEMAFNFFTSARFHTHGAERNSAGVSQNFHGGEKLFEEFTLGIEKSDLFAGQASDNQASVDTDKISRLLNNCLIFENGISQDGPVFCIVPDKDIWVLIGRESLNLLEKSDFIKGLSIKVGKTSVKIGGPSILIKREIVLESGEHFGGQR